MSVGSLPRNRKLMLQMKVAGSNWTPSTRKKLAGVAAGRDYPAMHRGWRHAVRLLAGAWIIAGLGTGVRSSFGASSGKSPELEQAIVDLKREYAAHVKNPEHEKLRTQASYFKQGSPVVLPDAVFAILEKPLPGVSANDARQAAYIKWQLMSALPEKLDDEQAKRLLKLYERAALPAAHYGCSKQEQKELDRLIAGARKEDDVKLTSALEQQAAKVAAPDRPILALRDELYRRLPLGRDKLVAGMTDARARLALAADKEMLAEQLAEDLTAWTASRNADRAQVREVVEQFGKLRMTESPPYYAYASVRSGKLGWRTRTDTLLSKRKLAMLHKQLLEAAETLDEHPVPAAAGGASTKRNGSKESSTKKAGTSS